MKNKELGIWLLVGTLLVSEYATASVKNVVANSDKTIDVEISIYNNNLAFVKDTRVIDLTAGNNKVAFVGVASQIKPETAMLFGKGFRVLEQNYDYNLLTPYNILNESVGKMVKTAIYNETTGETKFDEAKIIDSNNGTPILQFSYGIETNFPGRIIYEELPQNLREKPTLVIDVDNKTQGAQNLELAYLTGGINWKADYIADITSDDVLNINGWVTLDNQSGIDYKNAKVQVIAGNINQVNLARPVMARGMLMMTNKAMSMDMAETSAMPAAENFADYYLYNLPQRTTINNNQSKQVSLIAVDNVKYQKEYVLNSPLYLGINMGESEFEKQNPEVIMKIKNEKADNLGVPMPKGVMRFYENDSKGNVQFVGESNVSQTAIGEEIKLVTGKSFDVFAKGSVMNVKNIAKNVDEAEVVMTLNNAKSKVVTVNVEQNFSRGWEILTENINHEKKSATKAIWKVEIPANAKKELTFKVRITGK